MDFQLITEYYNRLSDKNGFVPKIDNGGVVFCYTDEKGYDKAKFSAFYLNLENIEFRAISKEEFFEILENIDTDSFFESDTDEVEDIEAEDILLSSHDDAPIIKLVNSIIVDASRKEASDIHIELTSYAMLIRFRIDGKLVLIKEYPKSIHNAIIARIKVIALLDVAESRKSQDGRINIKAGNRDIDIRVSTIPTISGEKAVLRLLETKKSLVSLNKIGMPPHVLKIYEPALRKTSGIILNTGPTGSGKTTTLYASLLSIERSDKNISTIEDPVEYKIDGINQVQVNKNAGVNFASAIRAFLRQDPDIILVGEIRDEETAKAAVQASLTGHLVLSTIHTNDASTAVTRLIDMDIEPFLVSSSLTVVMAQRLLRRICPECKERMVAGEDMKNSFGEEGIDVGYYYIGKGCDNCAKTGYRGRIGVFEILEINDPIRHIINKKASAYEIRELAKKHGFKTMIENGFTLVEEGITTPYELLSATRIG